MSEARGRKMHAALSVLFRWLTRQRRVPTNPCIGVWSPDAPPSRERVLSEAEIRIFWRGCERLGRPYGVLFKLLLLTGCRNEVTGMTRAELSDDGATWTIPSERTKNHRTHVVPLPPLARDILAAVPRIESAAGYLFTLSGTRPVTSFSGAKAQLDAAMLTVARAEDPASAVVPRWTLHDLRRTAATGMAELGIAPHIVEACLNHVSGSRDREPAWPASTIGRSTGPRRRRRSSAGPRTWRGWSAGRRPQSRRYGARERDMGKRPAQRANAFNGVGCHHAPLLPCSNPHSAPGTTACHFPRFRSLEAFVRRPLASVFAARPASAGIRNPSQEQT